MRSWSFKEMFTLRFDWLAACIGALPQPTRLNCRLLTYPLSSFSSLPLSFGPPMACCIQLSVLWPQRILPTTEIAVLLLHLSPLTPQNARNKEKCRRLNMRLHAHCCDQQRQNTKCWPLGWSCPATCCSCCPPHSRWCMPLMSISRSCQRGGWYAPSAPT